MSQREEQSSKSSRGRKQSQSPARRREESRSKERKRIQWYWNRADNPWGGNAIWIKYTDNENATLEQARSNGWPEVEFDGGDNPEIIRVVNFNYQVQHLRHDTNNTQRQVIRLVEPDQDIKNVTVNKKRINWSVADTYSRTEQEACE